MYIQNGIAYATTEIDTLEVTHIKPLDDWMMIVSFNNSDTHLLDGTELFDIPVFAPLQKDSVFQNAKVADGILTWLDGALDLATETLHAMSYKYETLEVS